MIPSVGHSNYEVIKAIIELHIPKGEFDLDPTFSLGKFYKGLSEPIHKFDIQPQRPDVIKADSANLPITSDSIQSIMFDPPFCFGGPNGPHGNQGKDHSGCINTVEKRFGIFYNFEALLAMYQGSLREFYRILKPKGKLVFKCQDYTDSKTTMTHCHVWQLACDVGFYPKDLFILVMPNKWYVKSRIQRHARKIHSYFWVLEKP